MTKSSSKKQAKPEKAENVNYLKVNNKIESGTKVVCYRKSNEKRLLTQSLSTPETVGSNNIDAKKASTMMKQWSPPREVDKMFDRELQPLSLNVADDVI